MAVTYEKVNLGKVVGKDGETPYIGNNGNWWIGDRYLGVSATTGPDFYRHIISFTTSAVRRAAYINIEFISQQSTEYTLDTLTTYLKSQGMSSENWNNAVFNRGVIAFPANGILVYTDEDYSQTHLSPSLGIIYDNYSENTLVALGMFNNGTAGFYAPLTIAHQTVTKV
jgi:hypothetical protein